MTIIDSHGAVQGEVFHLDQRSHVISMLWTHSGLTVAVVHGGPMHHALYDHYISAPKAQT